MANDAEVFSRPNTEARIHDFEQFTLWAPTPDRPGFRGRMTFGERNGAPRISVFPNFETGPKVLFVGMSPSIFLRFYNRFTEIIKGPGTDKDHIDNLDRDPNAERTENFDDIAKTVRNVLWFGKDEEGVCWIAIQQHGVTNMRFTILSSAWHHFYKPDGTRVSPQEGSAAEALALLEALKIAVSPYFARLRPPYDKNQAKSPPKPPLTGASVSSISAEMDDIPY